MDESKLPCAEWGEVAVLGSIILNNDCWYQTEGLTADDFTHFMNRRVYQAMMELTDEGRPIDFVTLHDVLNSKDQFKDNAIGMAYVTDLTNGLPRVKNISEYVGIVLKYSQKRKIIRIASSAISAAYDENSKPDEIIEGTDRKLLEVISGGKSEPKKLCDVLPEADARLEEHKNISLDREAVGHPTGLGALDRMIKGYFKREVTVIAGETSDGKSSLMRQGVVACGIAGIPQIIFSREVSRQQVAIDLKTYISGVFPAHVRDSRKMDLIEQERFTHQANKILRDWPLWIDDSRSLHIHDLFHKARKLIRMEGKKYPQSFIIWTDYAQLIQGSGSNKTERMEDVCAGHWTLADSENVSVVLLSQLNRDGDKGKKVRPTLRRLKDASRIEQDAHTLICPFQPENERGEVMPEDSQIIILKQRHGPRGTIPVRFDLNELIFKER